MGMDVHAPQGKRRSSGGFAITVTLLVVALLIALAATIIVAGPQLLVRSLPPSAHLPSNLADTASIQTLTERRNDEHSQLDSYGWVDKEAGIAHVPVAEAIQRMVKRGLPVGTPTAAAVTALTTVDTDVDTEVPDTVSFQNHVLPILVERCSECHGDDNPEEGLEVTSYRTLMLGSIYGAVVKAEDAEGSYLVEMITSGKMPKKGDPLTATQIEIIRAWIDAGALDN